MKNILTIISLVLFLICMGMCIYDAANDNMFCVAWAMNAIINFINFKSAVE